MRVVVWLLIAVMLTGIVYAFSTCRSETAEERVEITLFDWSSFHYVKLNRERIAIFEKRNPDIKVRLVTGDEGKYLTMVTGGVAPDVAIADHVDIPHYANRKSILPLDKFIAEDKDFDLDRYFPVTVESMRYKGRIYGLPDNGSPIVLLYNKELFKEYNNKHPDTPLTYPSDKWTWVDYRHAAKALTQDRNGDGKTDVYGASISFSKNRFPIQVWQNGGEVISADKKRCLMDSSEAIEAIQWLYDIMWVDKSSPTAYTQIEGAGGQMQGLFFAQQHIAMVMDTRYSYTNLIGKTNFEWDIAPVPKGPVSGVTLYIGGGWLISSQTHYPEQCWRLVKFLTDELSSEMSMRCGRALASNRAAAEKVVHHPGESPENDHFWIDAINNSRVKDFEFRGMWGDFSRARDQIQYISQGRRTPEQACRDFTRIYQKGLDRLWEGEGGP